MLNVIFQANAILLYCLFHIIKKLTFPSSIRISYMTDNQLQMLKKIKNKRFHHFQFPHCSVLFVPNNVERSKRINSRISRVIFALQQNNKERKCIFKQYINLLQVHYDISPCKKPVASDTEMERRLIPAGKGLYTACFCNLWHMGLESKQVTGDSRGAKGATFGVNIDIYNIL